MVHFYHVSKVYQNGVRALKDITVHISKGDFLFLVGPSGAGKTTLTKLLLREELPTKGQVIFCGKNVARLKPQEIPLLRRKIGVVFQDFRLLPKKTVYENIAFALEVIGGSGPIIKKRVPEALELVGLADKQKMFPSQLSGGEQQRAGIARAIVNRPLLLITDEPTGNLDPKTSWELIYLLQEINRLGTTIIMATHAWDIVNALKKRVVALSNGQMVRDEKRGVYGYGG
jgi:cell division transport system ATP-binding protein